MICGYCNIEFDGSYIKKLNGRVICSWDCKNAPESKPVLAIGGLSKLKDFNAGWCDTLKCYVSSYKDQEKKAREHRSRSHPQGFTMIQDNKKWVNELKNIRKYKGDYMKAELPGFKTKHMEKVYDAKRPDIHDIGRRIYSYAK